MPLGYYLHGFSGAVLGLSLTEFVRYAVSAAATVRSGVGNLSKDFVLTAAIAGSSGIGLLARQGFRGMSTRLSNSRLDSLVEGMVIFLALTLSWLVVFAVLRRRSPLETEPPVSEPS
jgi:hypothetical protein